MSEKELSEPDQRKFLVDRGWNPIGDKLGEGGGARVFRVVPQLVVERLAGPIMGVHDRVTSRIQALDLAQTIAEIADGSQLVVAAAKVAKLPSHRFEREIRALLDVQHPNLVRVVHHEPTDPTWYVMPVMRHGSLKDNLAKFKGDVRAVLRGMMQITGALTALHEKKIVHRDVKPGNVFVSETGEWILGDLGVAYRDDGADHTTTRPVSKDWFPRWYGDPLGHGAAADIYMLAETALYLLNGGTKLLDPSHLGEAEFNLPALFPGTRGIPEMYTLLKSLITSRHDDIAASHGSSLFDLLNALRPFVEHDELHSLRQELDRLKREPRLVWSYAAQQKHLGDPVALQQKLVWIPNCAELFVSINGRQNHAYALHVFDATGKELARSGALDNDALATVKLPPEVAGSWASLRLRVLDTAQPTGNSMNVAVYAVG